MKKIISSLLLVLGIASFVCGQERQTTTNTADQTLRSSGRVNPSTLGMEFDLPLGNYPGRGFNLPLSIGYSSKVWRFEDNVSDPGGDGHPIRNWVWGIYSDNAAAGWTSSLNQPYIEYTGDLNAFDQHGRPARPPATPTTNFIRRMNVFLPGGESHELRASDAPTSSPNWEGTFYAADGSGIRYVQNSIASLGPILYRLYLPDGSYYDFSSQSGSYGWNTSPIRKAERLTDANGNYVQFNAPDGANPYGSWTDQLGRVFPIMMPPETPKLPASQSLLTQEFFLPGIQTPYVFTWKRLASVFAPHSPSYVLHYIGGQISHLTGAPDYAPALFGNSSEWSSCSVGGGNKFHYVQVDNYNLALTDPDLGSHTRFNPMVLANIVLPNGAKYEFKYNEYAEIKTIHYPAGGHEKFDYIPVASLAGLPTGYQKANRGVSVSRVYENDEMADADAQTSYYYSAVSDKTYRTSVIAPDGLQTDNFMYRGLKAACDAIDPYNGLQYGGLQWGYDSVLAGKSYETRTFSAGTPSQIIQRTLTNWDTTPTNQPIQNVSPIEYLQKYPRVLSTQSETYGADGSGIAVVTSFEYDLLPTDIGSPLNIKAKHEHSYSIASGGSLPAASPTQTPPTSTPTHFPTPSGLPMRRTETTYQNSAAYKDRNLLKLPTQVLVKDGSGVIMAKSQVVYDETEPISDLISCGIQGWENPGTNIRGLPTTTKTWHDVNSADAYIATRLGYNSFGSPVTSEDANGNISQIIYTDSFTVPQEGCTYAYPTHTYSAVPGNGSTSPLETRTTYDFNTGLPVFTVDVNGQTTEMEYNDSLRRISRVRAPNDHQTITEYGLPNSSGQYPPSQRFVKVKSQIDANSWKEGYTWFDGLNRTFKTQTVDHANDDVFVMTCYDLAGRVSGTSNPSITDSTQPCTQNPTAYEWTTNTYDPSTGRLWKVTTPDGAFVETNYTVATGSTKGTVTTVKDQTGKLRRSVTNTLGHLVRVDEPDLSSATGSLGDISSPYQPTNFTYDLLNNLLTVTQNGIGTQCGSSGGSCSQTRTFAYDALSRLKQAHTPESGVIKYTYDSNGNLKTKWDARGIKTIYDYDNLNRVNKRCYKMVGTTALGNTTCASASGETAEPNTPDISYFYDNITNAKGKLTKVSSSVSTTEYTSFDILGRVTASKQTTAGGLAGGYTMGYTYDLAGALIEETYPSGRVVKNVLDSNGDLAIVQSKKNANTGFWRYADSFTYSPAGALTSMQLGNGRWESTEFNSRLQPIKIALGTTQNATNLLKLDYNYGTTQNNGNILSQTITVPEVPCPFGVFCEPAAFTAVQTYSYDSLNRIKSADESTNLEVETWEQTFDYDRYGNRRFDQANTTMPASFTNPPVTNPSISPNNNRITSVGWNYDAAGNTLTDASGQTYVYDGENRQVAVRNSQNQTVGEYSYDGDGNRVRKHVPLTGERSVFVFDAVANLVAEYSTSVASIEDAKVSYLTNDHLGSPRINTGRDGYVTARHDYHPFGEEILSSPRGAHPDYSGDTIMQKFTGKVRDNETDLDYFLARYYSSEIGRFTVTDPIIMEKSRLTDPQSMNLYVYTRNNPLKFVDPLGEKFKISGSDKDKKKYLADLNKRLKATGLQVKINSKGYLEIVGKTDNNLKDKTAVFFANAIKNSATANIKLVRNDGAVDMGTPFDKNGNLGSEQKIDYADLEVLNSAKVDNFDSSDLALHETIEAAAIQIYNVQNFDNAHGGTNNQGAPGLTPLSSRMLTDPKTGDVTGAENTYRIAYRQTEITQTSMFDKPIPAGQVPKFNSTQDRLQFRANHPLNITKIQQTK